MIFESIGNFLKSGVFLRRCLCVSFNYEEKEKNVRKIDMLQPIRYEYNRGNKGMNEFTMKTFVYHKAFSSNNRRYAQSLNTYNRGRDTGYG